MSTSTFAPSAFRDQKISALDPEAGLRVTEIFYSLQGEARYSGLPTVFVRLTGCPLRCAYCDTSYAFEGGVRLALHDVLARVEAFGAKYVCVTGGEPLAQPNCLVLLQQLSDLGYHVSLETSGALDVSRVDARVSKVLDLKTPSSLEDDKNLWSNLRHLTAHDQVKLVIGTEEDYAWAKNVVRKHRLQDVVGDVWFSPVFAVNDTTKHIEPFAVWLAEQILADQLPVRYGLQLHKLIWADAAGK